MTEFSLEDIKAMRRDGSLRDALRCQIADGKRRRQPAAPAPTPRPTGIPPTPKGQPMTDYPPADDRLKHLLAQEINLSVDTWKLAFWIADGIVKSPEIWGELERIAAAHHKGQPCGDRHCQRCFDAALVKSEALGAAKGCTSYVGDHIRCDRCTRSLEEHEATETTRPTP